jgi:hypothetical protein
MAYLDSNIFGKASYFHWISFYSSDFQYCPTFCIFYLNLQLPIFLESYRNKRRITFPELECEIIFWKQMLWDALDKGQDALDSCCHLCKTFSVPMGLEGKTESSHLELSVLSSPSSGWLKALSWAQHHTKMRRTGTLRGKQAVFLLWNRPTMNTPLRPDHEIPWIFTSTLQKCLHLPPTVLLIC